MTHAMRASSAEVDQDRLPWVTAHVYTHPPSKQTDDSHGGWGTPYP